MDEVLGLAQCAALHRLQGSGKDVEAIVKPDDGEAVVLIEASQDELEGVLRLE